jgi:DNA-directed RNA polymerase specialized sigma24 family protein
MAESAYSLGPFPPTHWSLVDRAVDRDPTLRRAGLDQFFRQYAPALLTYLVKRRRLKRNDAEDVLQGFLSSKILEQSILTRVDPAATGRFRNFLLVALNRYFVSEVRRQRARKRQPAGGIQNLDEAWNIADDAATDREFDRAWARQLVGSAVGRMHDECKRLDKPSIWGVFEARVSGPALEGAEPASYESLVKTFGFSSPREASNVMINAKRRFAFHLRAAISEYEGSEANVEQEIADLYRILAGRRVVR